MNSASAMTNRIAVLTQALLAAAIVSSREAIWGLLADPKKFATLEG